MRAMRAALPPRLSALIVLTDYYGFTVAEYSIICEFIANLYVMDSKLDTSERMDHYNPFTNNALFRNLITTIGQSLSTSTITTMRGLKTPAPARKTHGLND
jgi:hypothetical protein